MQDDYLRQAQENQRFLVSLEKQFPNDFFDWKTTVIFYIALHWMKAFLFVNYNGLTVESHEEIRSFYKDNQRKRRDIMPQHIWAKYNSLNTSCNNARYKGLPINYESWKITRQEDYNLSLQRLEALKIYFQSRRVNIQ
ncbi:hypothetical protein [Xanthocytophaga flava]|uniref:hypothetical protein n=1 Tax=Xanthocytophaga flava TaxID=3048013 RepID=UPI0028D613AD|nr:hypothetical protein [Xanthocytophaga flavus]MDJ1470273.1 hypothetical protein [Xanthocytophaga flavus]